MTFVWIFILIVAAVGIFSLFKFADRRMFGGKYTYIDHRMTRTEFLTLLRQLDDANLLYETLDRVENVPIGDQRLERIRLEIVQSIDDEKSDFAIGPQTKSLIRSHIELLSREP